MTPTNAALEAASTDYRTAEMSEAVFLFAGPELANAGDALDAARKAWRRRASKAEIDDGASLVVQRLVVARRVAAEHVAAMHKPTVVPGTPR